MVDRTEAVWRLIRMKLTRTRLKQLMSLIGATIILATFAAKDWRGDKVKELAASIQSAEHAFNTRSDQRRTYRALVSFQNQFETFASDPGKPLWSPERKQSTKKNAELDAETEDDIEQTYYNSTDLLDDIRRLRERLSADGQELLPIANLLRESKCLHKKVTDVTLLSDNTSNEEAAQQRKMIGANIRPHGSVGLNDEQRAKLDALHRQMEPKIVEVNKQLEEVDNDVTHFSDEVDDLRRVIMPIADEELDSDESASKFWTVLYNALFALGWIVTVVGIFIGEPEEKSLVEQLAER